MAKKPAQKTAKIEASADVILMEGDRQTDQASVRMRFTRDEPEPGHRRSSGMVIDIDLPEGIIVKDRDGARAMAKEEARKTLKAMLKSIK